MQCRLRCVGLAPPRILCRGPLHWGISFSENSFSGLYLAMGGVSCFTCFPSPSIYAWAGKAIFLFVYVFVRFVYKALLRLSSMSRWPTCSFPRSHDCSAKEQGSSLAFIDWHLEAGAVAMTPAPLRTSTTTQRFTALLLRTSTPRVAAAWQPMPCPKRPTSQCVCLDPVSRCCRRRHFRRHCPG